MLAGMSTTSLSWLEPTALEPIVVLGRDDRARLGERDLTSPVPGGLRCATDLLTDPTGRALAVAPSVPREAVIVGRAALWIHTGCGRSDLIDALVPAGTPCRRRPGIRWHTTRGELGEVCRVGSLRVRDPTGTAGEMIDRHAAEVRVRELIALGLAGADLREVHRRLSARPRHVRTRRHAVARLENALRILERADPAPVTEPSPGEELSRSRARAPCPDAPR